MRINNNIMSMNAHRALGINTGNQSKSLEKLASGLAVNRAADDAAGLSISEKMRGQIAGLERAAQNAQDGISYLQTAEGAMDEVSSMLTRLKELTVQKADGIYTTDEDIANLEKEMNQLGDEIADVITNTKFNGKNVFNASDAVSIAVTDSDVAASKFQVSLSSSALNSVNTLSKDATKLKSSSNTASVNTAINYVNSARAEFGAKQNRLESKVNNLNNVVENLQSAESRIRDTDMAKEMSNFNKNSILLQASTSMLAQANSAPQAVLSLLQ